MIIFPELRARCSATGSKAGLATDLSGHATRMFLRVNRSGFVQFCSSLCIGSALRPGHCDSQGSFAVVRRSPRCAALSASFLFLPTQACKWLSVQEGQPVFGVTTKKPLAPGGRLPTWCAHDLYTTTGLHLSPILVFIEPIDSTFCSGHCKPLLMVCSVYCCLVKGEWELTTILHPFYSPNYLSQSCCSCPGDEVSFLNSLRQ